MAEGAARASDKSAKETGHQTQRDIKLKKNRGQQRKE